MHRLRMQLDAHRPHDLYNGIEARFSTKRECFVQAGTTKALVFGDLRHASSLGYMANGANQFVGIASSKNLRQVFTDRLIGIK